MHERPAARLRRIWLPALPAPGETFDLPATELVHLARVLRLRPGDGFSAFDGRGGEILATLTVLEKRLGQAIVVEHVPARAPARRAPVTLCVAPPKGGHQEPMVRGLVELGVDHIVATCTSRGWLHKPAEGKRLQERWERLAIEACKQCGRNVTPAIECGVPLATAVQVAGARFVLDPEAPVGLAASLRQSSGDLPIILYIGPEGGFTTSEQELLQEHCAAAAIADAIMRVETAALAAAAVAVSVRGPPAAGG